MKLVFFFVSLSLLKASPEILIYGATPGGIASAVSAAKCGHEVTTPFFPASGPVTGSFNGLHPKSNFLAFTAVVRKKPDAPPTVSGMV
jgi:hypothetical protein